MAGALGVSAEDKHRACFPKAHQGQSLQGRLSITPLDSRPREEAEQHERKGEAAGRDRAPGLRPLHGFPLTPSRRHPPQLDSPGPPLPLWLLPTPLCAGPSQTPQERQVLEEEAGPGNGESEA